LFAVVDALPGFAAIIRTSTYLPATVALLNHIFQYLRFIARRFVEDRCLTVAGSLTYTSLLALVPVFTVTITLTSQLPVMHNLTLQVKAFIVKNLVPDAAGKVVTVYMDQFAQNAAQLTLIGLLIILATAVALMFTIDTAFNDIWRTRRRRSWWKRLVAYTSVLLIGPGLIGLSLSMTSWVVAWTQRFDRVLPSLDNWLLTLIPFVLTSLALVLAYRIMPNRHVPIRHALAGGVFAAVLFELVKHLFVAYVTRVPTYSLVYGAFASAPIFLVWLFCCWMVVLIGAEVTATFSYFRHADSQIGPKVMSEAVRILDALAAAGVPIDFDGVRSRAPMPIDRAEDALDALADAGLVVRQEVPGPARFRLAVPRGEISEDRIRASLESHA
jgi:membrane protein